MRAILRDKEDSGLIILEVVEAYYDKEEGALFLHNSTETVYKIENIIQINADSLLKEMAEKGFADMTAYPAVDDSD